MTLFSHRYRSQTEHGRVALEGEGPDDHGPEPEGAGIGQGGQHVAAEAVGSGHSPGAQGPNHADPVLPGLGAFHPCLDPSTDFRRVRTEVPRRWSMPVARCGMPVPVLPPLDDALVRRSSRIHDFPETACPGPVGQFRVNRLHGDWQALKGPQGRIPSRCKHFPILFTTRSTRGRATDLTVDTDPCRNGCSRH